jgi:predicted nucleic acid-binding protein
MTSQICVDSGILLKLLLNEPDSYLAEALWQTWLIRDLELIAPYLFPIEITAVIRKVSYRGLLETKLAEKMLRKALEFDIKYQTFPGIHERAWRLATLYNLPTAYDTHYLALAEYSECAFWTADERLFNSVRHKLHWVYWLGDSDF